MAFTDLTTELEELISKCEFENKQYVRAISQETQLLENINQEIAFKNEEMANLQSAIVHTEKETSHFERQCEYHVTNIESLKKTNDVLTEHIHAMKSKFEDVKSKRHEEKCSQDKQLQHFRDKWEEYKKTYEKFPLAVKLKKIQDEIRCSEENTERAKQEVENMKESIKKVENDKYWNSMDWKTFIIKLAENRLLAMKLKNEIEEIKSKKNHTEVNNNLHRPEVDTQDQELSSEDNIKKMTELHIPEDHQTNDEINKQHMEVCSPMISVLSDKDDDQTELMQTDETQGGLRVYIQGEIQTNRLDSTPSEQSRILQHQQPQVRNKFQENSMLNQLFPQPKEEEHVRIPEESPNQRELSKMQTSPSLPFVSYTKACHNNDGIKEKVDLHLNISTNKPSPIQVPQRPYTSHPLPIPKIKQATVQPDSSGNRPNQLSIRVPTPQPCKIPSQVTQSNPRRGPLPFPVPILSHRMPSLSPSVRGSRSMNFQPSIPVINRPGNLSRTPSSSTTSVQKSSPSIPSLSQPSVQNRSYVQLSNVPRLESRQVTTHGNIPQPSTQVFVRKSQQRSVNDEKQHQSDRTEDAVRKPAMLKEQTIKVLQSLKQQPSPCPSVTQDEIKNKTESTANNQPQPIVPCSQNQQISLDANPKPISQSQNMLDDIVYHQPLKDSPQKSTEFLHPNSKSPHKSPGKRKSGKSNSPFNIDKHRQKLEELKRSPGYPQYIAERRMFQSEVSITNDQDVHSGGDTGMEQSPAKAPINTAVFGGASQPSGDNIYTATPVQPSASEGNFNLFTNFVDSPGQNASHFISFGQDGQVKRDSPHFSFNFDQTETEQSPGVGFSFFDKRNSPASPPNFSFNFDAADNSFDKGNAMFGDNASENTNKSDGFFKLNFSKNDDDSDNFFSSFGNADGKEKPFSLFGSPSGKFGQEKPMFLFGGGDNAMESSELDGNFKINFDQNEKGGDNMLSLLFGGGSDSEKRNEKPTFLFNTSDKESDERQDFSFFNNFENSKVGD